MRLNKSGCDSVVCIEPNNKHKDTPQSLPQCNAKVGFDVSLRWLCLDGSSTARGCGLVGLSPVQSCDFTEGWTLCQCPEEKCNNLTNTATLLEYATSTTTTTTTTSTTTTTTTLSTTTTTSSGTTTLSSGGAQSVVGLYTTLTPAVVMMMSTTTTVAEAAASAVAWFVSYHKLVLVPYIYSYVINSVSL